MSKIIGIDLGTTNSLVSIMTPDGPEVLSNELGDTMTPSVVAIAEDGQTICGRAAKDRLVQAPDSGVSVFKRDMGTPAKYTFGDRKWTPTECSAAILQELKRVAEEHTGEKITRAVITVPAYFHDSQRQSTVEAAQIAGLTVERILNEPTAAALAFGYAHPDTESKKLIFDLGGGTFDVTLLEIFDGIIEIRSSGGESRLGGEDFTDAFLRAICDKHEIRLQEPERSRVRQQVEVLKRRLSKSESENVVIAEQEITVTRQDLEDASRELSSRLRPVIRRCLRDANVRPEDVDDVLLVGGATRMAHVRRFIGEEMARLPNQELDPDRVVALGAAVQAALCDQDAAVSDIVLTDVCPHTLGVEVAKELAPGQQVAGYFQPLIHRNTTIPVSRGEPFHTFHPQQDKIEVKVYQGESRMTHDNHMIGELTVSGLKQRSGQKQPGMVEIRFSYDMNGILEVEVTTLSTGKKMNKVFEQRPGALTKAEIQAAIERMAPLKVHPRDLLPNRARIERANRLFEELTGTGRDRLTQLLDYFEQALESQNLQEIQQATLLLDDFLKSFFAEEGEHQDF